MIETEASSATSSVGSDIFALISLLIISLLVLLLLRHFLPLRLTPSYLLVPIFLALVLPASIIFLVPIDLASIPASEGEYGSRRIHLSEKVLLLSWRITYWLCFALTWLILPILGEYVDSGDRTPKGRLLYSLRSNGRYQLVTLGSGLVGFLYVSLQLGLHTSSIRALVMGLAYFWGLFIAIYLMGHGLVAVPRRALRNGNISGRLRRLQTEAPRVHDKLDDALLNLSQIEDQILQLQQRKNSSPRDLRDWIDELADMSNLPESRIGSRDRTLPSSSTEAPTVITDGYLADLTRKLSRARHQKARFIESWDRLWMEAVDTQAILDSAGSKRLDFGRASPHSSSLSRIALLTPYTRYLLHYHVLPTLSYVQGAVFTVASACVAWSELIKAINVPKLSLISLTVIHSGSGEEVRIGLMSQLLAAGWILYMCTAALTSINDAKIWGNRALVRRNTYGESACWYSSQIARLTVPLAYNFVTFFPETMYQKTTFYRFLGHFLDRTAFGEGFDRFFPVFIFIPACATLFNLYGRVRDMFGFGFLKDLDEEGENDSGPGYGTWREGQTLIDRELRGTSTVPGLSRDPSPHDGRAGGRAGGAGGRAADLASQTNSTRHSAPTLTIPADRSAPRRPTREPLASQEPEADGDDSGNFFTDFAHRFQNTVDTTTTPRWMKNIGEGIKKPKWMSNEGDQNERGARGSGSIRGGGRWLGGNSGDGRIRL
ncbi:MAG: hypothetical protein M4579_004601 [Chaenotheca gracillima]|nr:MAG: hypothetical protein M4579_004601 [Chaenotheca gracillima]